MLAYVGDSLERKHAVSVGQLFWCYPGCHVVLCCGAIALVTASVYWLFQSMKVVSSLFSVCVLAAANYRL